MVALPLSTATPTLWCPRRLVDAALPPPRTGTPTDTHPLGNRLTIN